jgi:hypothetical protein
MAITDITQKFDRYFEPSQPYLVRRDYAGYHPRHNNLGAPLNATQWKNRK